MALNILSEIDDSSTGDDVDEGFAKAITNFALLDDLLHGFCRRAKFRWKDSDEIYIGSGVYFHEGTSNQTLYWNSELTFQLGSGGTNGASSNVGNNQLHYIYIDDSAVVSAATRLLTNTEFLNSTTAPSWSASKHGWYNSSDRCIGCFLSDGSGNIIEFTQSDDFILLHTPINTENVVATFTDSYTDANTAFSIPAFSNRAMISVRWAYVDAYNALLYRPNGSSGNGIEICNILAGNTEEHVILDVLTDSNALIELREDENSTNTVTINQIGWYLPEGM